MWPVVTTKPTLTKETIDGFGIFMPELSLSHGVPEWQPRRTASWTRGSDLQIPHHALAAGRWPRASAACRCPHLDCPPNPGRSHVIRDSTVGSYPGGSSMSSSRRATAPRSHRSSVASRPLPRRRQRPCRSTWQRTASQPPGYGRGRIPPHLPLAAPHDTPGQVIPAGPARAPRTHRPATQAIPDWARPTRTRTSASRRSMPGRPPSALRRVAPDAPPHGPE